MFPIIADTTVMVSYLPRAAELADSTIGQVVDLTNRTIFDVIGDLTTSIPAEVEGMALEVAARALRPMLPTSVTMASSNTSKTVRYEAQTGDIEAGVYLTASERNRLRTLIGQRKRRRPRTIRTFVP